MAVTALFLFFLLVLALALALVLLLVLVVVIVQLLGYRTVFAMIKAVPTSMISIEIQEHH